MKLRHYSSKPIDDIYDTSQDDINHRFFKPYGLWISIEPDEPDDKWMDWRRWCEAEDFGIGSMLYSVELDDDANILRIGNIEEFLSFSDKYKPNLKDVKNFFWTDGYIDWLIVSEEYDGIFIAPYFWEFRLQSRWYYPWDCASGVIWKAKAIAKIKLLTDDWKNKGWF